MTMLALPESLLQFVNVAGDRLVTDTLRVARHFRKAHKNVLRAYDNRDCSAEFSRLNFEPREYRDHRGKVQRIVEMTKNGFMFLVMSFTGAEAARVKEAYIAAFDALAAFVRSEHRNLLQQLNDVEQWDRTSLAHASAGAYALLDRKAVKPSIADQRRYLLSALQLTLPFGDKL